MTRWQQLGGYIITSENVDQNRLMQFSAIGGRWVVIVLINDDSVGPDNLKKLPEMQTMCQKANLSCGLHANYFGEPPAQFAKRVADLANNKALSPIMLDCEASVQGNTLMSSVAKEIRVVMPKPRGICVTTNSLNDSVVYNGRIEGLAESQWRSFRRHDFRVSPQWYDAPVYGHRSNPWTCADLNMEWLQAHGMEDNLRDASYANKRAVTLASVHPVFYPTGVEGANLEVQLDELRVAKKYGFTTGCQMWSIENIQGNDWNLLAKARDDKLFLV